MIQAIVVTEGEYAETREFRDAQHLSDFSAGFACGAGHYGAGGFGIYALEDADTVDDPELAELIRAFLVHEV
jgi:hypothetical protein